MPMPRGSTPGADNPVYLLRDWLENGLPAASFDAVVAIESSEHMADKAAFFVEAARVLRPGAGSSSAPGWPRPGPRRWERGIC